MSTKIYDGNGKVISVEDIPILISGCPAIYITCDTAYNLVTKFTAVNATVTLIDNGEKKLKNIPVKMKLQGNTATQYNKRSFNITFYEDTTYKKKKKYIFNDWYPTNKIHVKGNPSDFSFVRNSVSAKVAKYLFGKHYPNHAMGMVESLPCILYYNGVFRGCYTFNLPQDDKLFNMDDGDATNVAWRCDSNVTDAWKSIDRWEIRSENEDVEGVTDSFTSLLAIMSDTENLTKAIVEQHFDVGTLLGYMMLCQIGKIQDQMGNNWTMGTWDGVTWYTFAYDMDYGFGVAFGGNGTVYTGDNLANYGNSFFQAINTLYTDELKALYCSMRDMGVNASTLTKFFVDFKNTYGYENIKADYDLWLGADGDPWEAYQGETEYIKGKDIYNLETWLPSRISYLDTLYEYSTI